MHKPRSVPFFALSEVVWAIKKRGLNPELCAWYLRSWTTVARKKLHFHPTWLGVLAHRMKEPQHLQPVIALGEIVVMHQEQAEVNKHQLGALHVQMEEQTQLQQLQLLSQGQGHHLSLLIRPQLSCCTNWRQRMTFLNKLNLPTLSKEIADNLNALITQEELTKALNQMPNYKSPRPDGCPAETFLAHTLVTIS